MMFIGVGSSKNLEVAFGETAQPIVDVRFGRGDRAQIRFFDNLLGGNQAHDPAGKAPGDVARVGYPVGDKLRFAAENAVLPVAVHNPERLVEPASFPEHIDKLLQEIIRHFIQMILNGQVSPLHPAPVSGVFPGPPLRYE
jgi:hypothetical protein